MAVYLGLLLVPLNQAGEPQSLRKTCGGHVPQPVSIYVSYHAWNAFTLTNVLWCFRDTLG